MKQPKQIAPPIDIVTGPFDGDAGLPPRVAALRAKILEACAARDIEALKIPLQWSETPPVVSRGADRPRGFAEIVPWLKRRSFDGEGREMVAIVAAVFSAPHVRILRGAFVNYGWPALAWIPPSGDDAKRDALRVLRFADLARPAALHRGVIGADGTWHSFLAEA